MFLRNVLHPPSDWLYLVQVETELNGRRKWVNHAGRLQGLLWTWVTQREEERDLEPYQLSKRAVLQSFYIFNPSPSISFSLCLKQIQSPWRWAQRIPQKHRIKLTILQRVITYKTVNCATPALEAWTISQAFIYSVFLMAKPDVNVLE